MSQSPYGYAARLADAYSRSGTLIVLRQVSGTNGPAPLINPPRVTNATLAGPVGLGSTAVTLNATAAAGQLLPGDILVAAGVQLVVSASAAARSPMTPGFAVVGIEPAPVAISAGTPVTFIFAADKLVYGQIRSFPISIVDGDKIRSRQLQLTISAYGLPDEIPPDWSVLVGPREMSIVSATPVYKQGEIMSWTILAQL